jgi:uncharacterized protein YndB with AHSA1/START domain
MSNRNTRDFETSIEIDAPPSVVWMALIEADQLTRWFSLEAAVEPKAGGRYFLGWGEAFNGEARILAIEPERRLSTTWNAMTATDLDGRPLPNGALPLQLSVDYHLSARSGGTVVRLVHSGFGRNAAWDDEYDSISSGWAFELWSLKHYLERHRGRQRRAVWVVGAPQAASAQSVWRRILSEGFGADVASVNTAQHGARLVLPRAGADAALELDVGFVVPDRKVAGVARALDDALFRVFIEPAGVDRSAHLWLSFWGDHQHAADAIEAHWRALLKSLFG